MTTGSNTIAADRLRSFVDRIMNLEEDRSAINADIREVKSEAKSTGFDMKALNEVLRLERMEKSDREEFEALRELYVDALHGTPLGDAAAKKKGK